MYNNLIFLLLRHQCSQLIPVKMKLRKKKRGYHKFYNRWTRWGGKKEEDVQQVLEEYEESQSESEQGFKRVKSFKDMNVQERIDYLLHFPKQLPPVPCLFISDDKHIRGFIELKQGNELMIKTLSGSMQTIHIHSIKSIKMVGFRWVYCAVYKKPVE